MRMEQAHRGERKLLRAFDIGRLFGYSTATIKRWAKGGQLPAVFIGRHIRFDPEQVENFIRAGGRRSDPMSTSSRAKSEGRNPALAEAGERPSSARGKHQSKCGPAGGGR